MRPHCRSPMLISAFVLLIPITACDDSTTAPDRAFDPQERHALLGTEVDVTLRAESESFEPGAAVALVLENRSDQTIGFNLCFHGLEQRTDGVWGPAEEQWEKLWLCAAVMHTIGTAETASFETSLPESLSPGEYRFRIALHLLETGDDRDQVSDAFDVEG